MPRSRESLLKAAAESLRRTGFQNTSMADIAAEVGVPRTALYYHFGGKGNLLAEILIAVSDENYQNVSDVASMPLAPFDRLRLVIRALVLRAVQDPSGGAGYVHPVATPLLSKTQREALIESRDRIDKLFRNLVAEAITAGTVRPVDVPIVSNAILTAISRLSTWYRSDGPVDPEELANTYTDFFCHGLAAGPPPAPRQRK